MGLYPVLTQDEAKNRSSSEKEKLKKGLTPTRFRTFVGSGEAGYCVELAVFGGVVFMHDDKCASYNFLSFILLMDFAVAIATSDTCKKKVSVDAVRELKRLGLCKLVSLPNPMLLSLTPIQGAPAILSDSSDSDDEALFLNHCPREYPGMKFHSSCCLMLTDNFIVLDHIAATRSQDDQIDENFDDSQISDEDFGDDQINEDC